MKYSTLSFSQGCARVLSALFASTAIFIAGCANMVTTAAGLNPLDIPATIGGKLHGGNQPVAFATVKNLVCR